jgi:hypothetical protein
MNNSMLAKQYDFSRCADEPFPLFRWCIKIQFLHGQCESVIIRYPDVSVLRSIECYGAGVDECSLEVIQKIMRVFDTNTKADKVFGQTAGSSYSRVDRCVPVIPQQISIKNAHDENTLTT